VQVPYIGVLPAPSECIVPPGAKIVDIKLCETCGFAFVRANQDRNCRRCHSRPEPLGREVEMEILRELFESERPVAQ
jgi:hypothetical protein